MSFITWKVKVVLDLLATRSNALVAHLQFQTPVLFGCLKWGDRYALRKRAGLTCGINSHQQSNSHHSYYRLQTTASIPIFKFPNRNTAADQSDIKMDISQRLSM